MFDSVLTLIVSVIGSPTFVASELVVSILTMVESALLLLFVLVVLVAVVSRKCAMRLTFVRLSVRAAGVTKQTPQTRRW